MTASLCNPFMIPDDDWFHIAATGEWPHKPTGLLQIIDEESMDAIASDFYDAKESDPHFPGILIDFDHQSLDTDKPSVAAGWILDLDKRPNGLWAKIRWSDLGRQSIEGGRYRFISPVWRSSDCLDLGENRIRPLRLMNCAVTNDPNIKGLFPLSNSGGDAPRLHLPPIHLPLRQKKSPEQITSQRELKTRQGELIDNRGPMTDEQRKAMFARQGGPGGSTGSRWARDTFRSMAGGGSQPAQPVAEDNRPEWEKAGFESKAAWNRHHGAGASVEDPDNAPSGREIGYYESKRNSEGRIAALRAEREKWNPDLIKKPTEPKYSTVDLREVQKKAMSEGLSLNEVNARVEAAARENARRRSAFRAIKDHIKRTVKGTDERAKALTQYMKEQRRYYEKDLDRYERERRQALKKQTQIDAKIAEEEMRWEENIARDQYKAEEAEAKEQAKLIAEQIKADKAAADELAKAETKPEDTRPPTLNERVKAARQIRSANFQFWEHMMAGNTAMAKAIYPDADISAVKETVRHGLRSKAQWNRVKYSSPPGTTPTIEIRGHIIGAPEPETHLAANRTLSDHAHLLNAARSWAGR